jgi:hypothetical protein
MRHTPPTVRTPVTNAEAKPKSLGLVLYHGPSLLNGRPIVCIATGLACSSLLEGDLLMPRVVTSLHDPIALAVLCDRLGVAPPVERAVHLDTEEVFGWVVWLRGLRHPVVCDTLTGLIAYHPLDNAHARYAHLTAFVDRYYVLRHRLRRGDGRPGLKGRRSAALETV